MTELRLRGSLGDCSVGAGASRHRGEPGQAREARRRRRRRLWGRGRGHFRTRGRHSSATVRGTTWLVEDRCKLTGGVATITRVKFGQVRVRDFITDKTKLIGQGGRYVATFGPH